jgi:hypothetical protein
MRYREFGVSTIESDRNRILEQSSHGLSDVFGVSSPACQGKAQYEYSLVWLEARRTKLVVQGGVQARQPHSHEEDVLGFA